MYDLVMDHMFQSSVYKEWMVFLLTFQVDGNVRIWGEVVEDTESPPL